MARSRSADYEVIRDSLIESAAALFARKGYAATSIEDIAEACDCSKSRLYHYFNGKEKILYEILNTHVDALIDSCRTELPTTQGPKDRFYEIVKLMIRTYVAAPNRHAVMLTCLDALSPEYKKTLIGKQRELIGFVRNALEELRPDIATNRAHMHVDTMLFFGMINWTHTWYHADGLVSPEVLAERTLEVFLNGYMNLSAG